MLLEVYGAGYELLDMSTSLYTLKEKRNLAIVS